MSAASSYSNFIFWLYFDTFQLQVSLPSVLPSCPVYLLRKHVVSCAVVCLVSLGRLTCQVTSYRPRSVADGLVICECRVRFWSPCLPRCVSPPVYPCLATARSYLIRPECCLLPHVSLRCSRVLACQQHRLTPCTSLLPICDIGMQANHLCG